MDRFVISLFAAMALSIFALAIMGLLFLDSVWVVLALAIGATGGLSVWLIDWLTGRTDAT